MPRETAKQRAERLIAEQSLLDAERSTQYLTKLMAALEEATVKSNYELTVRNGQFHLRDRDSDSWRSEVSFSPVYSSSEWNALEELEWDLQRKDDERKEQERRHLLRQAALNKLSKEEKELLGL